MDNQESSSGNARPKKNRSGRSWKRLMPAISGLAGLVVIAIQFTIHRYI